MMYMNDVSTPKKFQGKERYYFEMINKFDDLRSLRYMIAILCTI